MVRTHDRPARRKRRIVDAEAAVVRLQDLVRALRVEVAHAVNAAARKRSNH
jgi:hypothetical protein